MKATDVKFLDARQRGPDWVLWRYDCGCLVALDGAQDYRFHACPMHNAAPELLAACEAADQWLQKNVAASNRPATLDKQLMDAIANAKPKEK